MSYYAILTDYGIAADIAAAGGGPSINLTHMAVGNGSGNPVTPVSTMTALVFEKHRVSLLSAAPDPNDATQLICKATIPADVGGWTIREVGIYDDSGNLFAVANFPETYKPTAVDGAAADLSLNVVVKMDNADSVTLVIDPTVVTASKQYVDDHANRTDNPHSVTRAMIGAMGADDFPVSFGVAGWQLLPSGLILQWGQTTCADGDTVVTLPISFSEACWQVVVSGGAALETLYDYQIITHSYTATSFIIRVRMAQRHNPVHWFAIGR